MFPLQRVLLMGLVGWVGAALWPAIALGQITPDSTLGLESSIVTSSRDPNTSTLGDILTTGSGGRPRTFWAILAVTSATLWCRGILRDITEKSP